MLISEDDLWRDVTAGCDVPCTTAEAQSIAHGVTAEVIAGRRSVRAFAPSAVATERLTAILRAANTADLKVLAPDARFGVAITALRVGAYAAGTYLVDGDGMGRPCDAQPDVTALAATYADAAALFLVYGSPGSGPHAYSGLLCRAGAFGQSLWLAGRADGLEGCVYGGALREVTDMLRATTGQPVRHLFTIALGEPR